jgi:uncharacterized MAPEG superfamily protein
MLTLQRLVGVMSVLITATSSAAERWQAQSRAVTAAAAPVADAAALARPNHDEVLGTHL